MSSHAVCQLGSVPACCALAGRVCWGLMLAVLRSAPTQLGLQCLRSRRLWASSCCLSAPPVLSTLLTNFAYGVLAVPYLPVSSACFTPWDHLHKQALH